MMRSLSARTGPAAKLNASTNEAIKMFFIDSPSRSLAHLTQSPARGHNPESCRRNEAVMEIAGWEFVHVPTPGVRRAHETPITLATEASLKGYGCLVDDP